MKTVKGKLFHDLSANSSQVIINQLCGLVIFYIMSVNLSKNDFGQINWALAVLLTVFSILSLGIDQVMVKKIAEGTFAQKMLSMYFIHVLFSGGLFYLLLLTTHFFFPGFQHNLLIFFGFGKLMIFFASPFKQLANGLEKFRLLLYMSVCSNIIKSLLLVAVGFWGYLSLSLVIAIFITGDILEFLVSFIITRKILRVRLQLSASSSDYFSLIRESLPQAGVVIFTSAIARFDWIFLGILASNIALAEYSFAFKVFEVASLPLLVIAPILIPRFTRIFSTSQAKELYTSEDNLTILFRFEMIVSSFIILVLNILWIPVIDFITHNKYGSVNRDTIFILSLCMPFIYANNFLWTINFAKGKLKMIFYVFLITFLFNLILDVTLIPDFGGEGAAAAYLTAILIQFVLFRKKTGAANFTKNDYAIATCPLAAIVSGMLAMRLFTSTIIILSISILFFIILLFVSRQLRVGDWHVIKRIVHY